ncbi:MAG: hypothetical protein ABJC04_06365 [Verrucomicrobiota bacterium]
MKYRILLSATFLVFSLASRAELPPAEKLLSKDALMVVSIPDAAKLRADLKNCPQTQLWNDPAMKAFKDKFLEKFKADMVAPLEKELGLKLSDYLELAQEQVTFAVTQNNGNGDTNESPGWILLVDARDKSAALKTSLATLKKKWVDSGKQIKTDKVRDVEFTTLITTSGQLAKPWETIFPKKKAAAAPDDADPKSADKKLEIIIGQSGSLLLVGSSAKAIEKVLVHQSGSLAPTLLEESAFETSYNALFRDASFYVWFHVKPFVQNLLRTAPAASPDNPLGFSMDKLVSGLGIAALDTAGASFRNTPEGSFVQLLIGVPEANRQGLFKILAPENKDSKAPAFVPADAMKFSRWRLNLPKVWTGLEKMLTDVSPAFGGAFQLIFESAGKDKDPNYDLKKELLANLGDDLINYEKKSPSVSLDGINSPPSLFLIGSPNAEKLATALKIGFGLLSPDIKDRDFLGRKIYTVPPSPLLASSPKVKPRTLNFAAGGGYVAFSTDVSMLEEYLRSGETKAKPLSETAGLAEAAEKVGGAGSGFFGYNNQNEEMRATFAALKNDSVKLTDLLKNPAQADKSPEEEKKINDWADFSLLPSFDVVAKYFYYSVYGGSFNANGFSVKVFYPTPPALKK